MAKRILFSLLCLLIPVLGMAQRISADEAANIAAQVLGKKVVKAEMKAPAKASSVKGTTTAEPFYSIFTGEDGKGFVIVSTDQRAPQIIGYGDGKADANNLPPQLKAILAKQDSVLQATPNLPEHESWRSKAPRRAGEEGGKLLKTANWGQGYPYNLMTPEIDGEHCLTGCVATAMAIIMKYHGWPEKGRCSHTYIWNGQVLSYNFQGITFDWDSMLDDYIGGQYTESQANAVATLMSSSGVAISMDYSSDASEADGKYIPFSMWKYFKYDLPKANVKDPEYWYNRTIPYEEWIEYVLDEIDEGYPILYLSQDNNIKLGHAFVIDGYDSSNKVHVNWGWDGYLNGYFAIDALATDNGNYSDLPRLVRNIRPDVEAPNTIPNVVLNDGSVLMDNHEYLGINIDADKIERNTIYTASYGVLSAEDIFYYEYIFALIDKNNNIKELAKDYNGSEIRTINPNVTECVLGMDYNECSMARIQFTGEISPTDRVCIIYRETEDGEWKIVPSIGQARNSISVSDCKAEYVDINITKPANVTLIADIGSLKREITETSLSDRFPKDLWVSFHASSAEGVPTIYVNGELRSVNTIEGALVEIYSDQDINMDVKCLNYSDMKTYELEIEFPGTLSENIPEDEAQFVRSLTLSGHINMSDIYYINNNFKNLEILNLQQSDIDSYEQYPANTLGTSSLNNCVSLKELILPAKLISIGDGSFKDLMGLESLVLPKSLINIGTSVFFGCFGLRSLILQNPYPIEFDNDPMVFYYSHFKDMCTLYVPKGSKPQYEKAELWRDFARIVEYENIEDCKTTWEDLYIRIVQSGILWDIVPDDKCPLVKRLTLAGELRNDLQTVSNKMKNLEYLNLKDGYIGLNDCMPNSGLINLEKLTELILPDNLRGFESYSMNLPALKNVHIPNSVNYVEEGLVFYGCDALTNVIMYSSEPFPIYYGTFFTGTHLKEKGTLYVPKDSKAAYENAEYWKDFPNIIEYEGEWHETLPGDLNGDSQIDSQDVFSVTNMVLDKETSGDVNAADMNGDGQIDSQDVFMIINKVLGK